MSHSFLTPSRFSRWFTNPFPPPIATSTFLRSSSNDFERETPPTSPSTPSSRRNVAKASFKLSPRTPPFLDHWMESTLSWSISERSFGTQLRLILVQSCFRCWNAAVRLERSSSFRSPSRLYWRRRAPRDGLSRENRAKRSCRRRRQKKARMGRLRLSEGRTPLDCLPSTRLRTPPTTRSCSPASLTVLMTPTVPPLAAP